MSPSRRRPATVAEAGYSLLEVLVALAILSLAVAVVAPDMRKGLSAASRRTLLMDVERYVLDARRMAMDSESAVVIAAPEPAVRRSQADDDTPGPPLPRGWVTISATTLRVDGAGVCDRGRMIVRRPGEKDAAFSVSGGNCVVAPS